MLPRADNRLHPSADTRCLSTLSADSVRRAMPGAPPAFARAAGEGETGKGERVRGKG
jgi:hypothetical protein